MLKFKIGENVVDRFLNEKCVIVFRYRSYYLAKSNKREFWCKNTDLISLDNNKEKAMEISRLDSELDKLYVVSDELDKQMVSIRHKMDELFDVRKTKKN